MASVTKTMGILAEPGGTVAFEVDYDDVALRLTTARIRNDHPTLTARGTATADAQPNRTYTLDGPPQQVTVQAIPGGALTRLDITVDARGRIDGVGYQFGWLVP